MLEAVIGKGFKKSVLEPFLAILIAGIHFQVFLLKASTIPSMRP